QHHRPRPGRRHYRRRPDVHAAALIGLRGNTMDLKETQAPLKTKYREDAEAALITLSARASEQEGPTSCSIDIGRAIYQAQAHAGVGGAGTAACSGDMLLAALA